MGKILKTNENEYFEMRFHSIGGQGAYTIGKMIAQIGFLHDEIKSSVFATYGSEKKGAPVSVFVRMLEGEKITKFSAVKNPDVVVVFHEQLLKTINVLEGLKPGGKLIVNSDLEPQELVNKYNLNISEVSVIDATKYAMETKSKANTVMFGAIMKELDSFDKQLGIKEIEKSFSSRYANLIEANEKAYNLGYEKSIGSEVTPSIKESEKTAAALGYETQYEGGIIRGNNAQKVDRSISREGYIPKFDKSLCINCTKCDMTCPDDCFVWKEEEGRRGRKDMTLQGIDYKHCKGCLRCVKVCPTKALFQDIETREYAKENTVEK